MTKLRIIAIILLHCFMCRNTYSMQFALTKKGYCREKAGSAILKMEKRDCEKIGGTYNGRVTPSRWIDCYLDWCKIPLLGFEISDSISYIISPKNEQTLITPFSTPTEKFRPSGVIKMRVGDCKKLNGLIDKKLGLNQWIDCNLKFRPYSGSARTGRSGVMLSQAGDCGKFNDGYGSILLSYDDCAAMGGMSNKRRGVGTTMINCILDFCEVY